MSKRIAELEGELKHARNRCQLAENKATELKGKLNMVRLQQTHTLPNHMFVQQNFPRSIKSLNRYPLLDSPLRRHWTNVTS